MSPSRQKYREAVQAAKDFCYGNITDVPEHFDEGQRRIFNREQLRFTSRLDIVRDVMNDLY